MKNLLVTFLTSLFIISYSQLIAQQTIVSEDWQTSAGSQNFFHKSFAKTGAGSYVYVTGATLNGDDNYDLLIAKYNSSGVLQWINQVDGAGHGDDVATGVYIDGSSNVFITGTVYTGTTDSNDIVTIKYNSSGSQQWQTIKAGPAHRNDFGTAITGDGTGNVFITGATMTSSHKTDFITIKYNSSGTQQWASSYDGSAHPYDGGAKISYSATTSGVSVAGGAQTSSTNVEYRTLNYNATTGAQTATSGSGGSSSGIDEINDLVIDASGNVYVTGGIVNTGTGYDIYTIKMNSSLATQWTATYNAPDSLADKGKAIIVDASGNVYITGYSSGATTNKDAVTIKYNSSGAQQWASTFNNNAENGDDEGADIERRSNGEIITSGYSFNGANKDYNTIKYNSSGELQWIKSFNGSSNGDDLALDLALDAAGDIIVCGQSWVDTAFEYVTVKYSEYERDFDIVSDTSDNLLYISNEVVIKFNPRVVIKDVVDRVGYQIGTVSDFIADSTVDKMNDVLDFDISNESSIRMFKVFSGLTSNDTFSITRSGDTIRMPLFWTCFKMTLPPEEDVFAVVDSLNTLFPDIEFAEIDRFMMLTDIPEDNEWSEQHSLFSSTYPDADIDMPTAWDFDNGASYIKIGVYDSGINWQHNDFSINGGLSFEDTKIFGGWDWGADQPLDPPQNGDPDPDGHGSAIAGIIGALRNNSNQYVGDNYGVAGITGGDMTNNDNYGCQLWSMKIVYFDNNEDLVQCAWSEFAEAIVEGAKWSPGANTPGYDLNVMNNSYGAIAEDYENDLSVMRLAVLFALQNEVVFVASRGNDGDWPNLPIDGAIYPACFPDEWVLSVGACGIDGEAKTSGNGNPLDNTDNNYSGMYGLDMDFIAPGSNALVWTTDDNSDFIGFNGTSAAAPHVAGLSGLLLSHYHWQNPNDVLAPEDVEHIIQYTCQDRNLPSNPDYDDQSGWGLIDAGLALSVIDEPTYDIYHRDGDPTSYTATDIGDFTISLVNSFSQSIPAGWYDVVRYKVVYHYEVTFSASQILDVWMRLSSVSGYSQANPVTAEPYYEDLNISINGNQLELDVTTYMYYIEENGLGQAVNEWMPAHPADLKLPFTAHLLNWPVSAGEISDFENSIRVYPNPAANYATVMIDQPSEKDCLITLTDLSGKIIQEFSSEYIESVHGIIRLKLHSLSSGLYFVNFLSPSTSLISKLVITK